MDPTDIAGLLVAVLGGAAIGLERQWSGHATGARAHFGGIRTFTLLGGIAGVAGWLSTGPLRPFSIILLAAAALLIVVGYARASRTDIDGTTEVAAIVVLTAGTVSGSGAVALASALIAATAVLLVEKTRLHAMVAHVDEAAMRASARFAAMALIVLPLLPDGPYGPLDAIRPRELWALVLFFSGLSFLGWVARRTIGAHRGVIVAGLLGGVISSTSVTLRFAQQSRRDTAAGHALAAGAIGACTVMLLRVFVACLVLNAALAARLPRFTAAAFLLGTAVILVLWRMDSGTARNDEEGDTPLQLRSALQMTVLFQLVLFVILAVQMYWGTGALVATSAFVGLTDLDALTFSLARSATTGAGLTPFAVALVAGILANTLLKLAVAVVVGRGSFRTITAVVLGAMAALVAATLVL